MTKKAIATRRKTKKARTGLVLIAILMNEQGKTEVQWFFTEAIVCLSESSFVLALNTSPIKPVIAEGVIKGYGLFWIS